MDDNGVIVKTVSFKLKLIFVERMESVIGFKITEEHFKFIPQKDLEGKMNLLLSNRVVTLLS